MLPANWLAFALVFLFALIFVWFFWLAKRQGLLAKDSGEEVKYVVFEEDEQDFEDVI